MVRVKQEAGLDSSVSSRSLVRRLVLLSCRGIVPEPLKKIRVRQIITYKKLGNMNSPKVELSLGDPVRVEVGGQGRDVAHVGVIHQGVKRHGSSVEIVQDL